MPLDRLLDRLWADYVGLNPQVGVIHALLRDRGERVVNDHIALRTFADPRIGLEALARPFLAQGYAAAGDYAFPRKRLRARYYLHADPDRPKIFISELLLDRCTPALRRDVERLLGQVDAEAGERSARLERLGRPWPACSRAVYGRLLEESEYAAWLAAFGLRANHFTVSVNALTSFASLGALNSAIEAAGIAMSRAGGLIKGSPEELLEQSSTLAAPVEVAFADGSAVVPGCYYEFARRYAGADGRLFTGFVPDSADRIFESTDRAAADDAAGRPRG